MGIDAHVEVVLPVEHRVERHVVIVPARDEEDAHGVLGLRRGTEEVLGGSGGYEGEAAIRTAPVRAT